MMQTFTGCGEFKLGVFIYGRRVKNEDYFRLQCLCRASSFFRIDGRGLPRKRLAGLIGFWASVCGEAN